MQQTICPAVSPQLTEALLRAASYAGEQLGRLLEREIRLQGLLVERVPLEQLPSLLRDEDRLVTAIYVGFSGQCEGHVVLSFDPDAALQLIATLLMLPASEVVALEDMERSVLSEIGNITTASFLNALADAACLIIHPSPPIVVEDMIGALLSTVVVEMSLEAPQALMVHTAIQLDGDHLRGDLILLPSAASCSLLEARLR